MVFQNFKTFVLLPEVRIGQLGARYIYDRLMGKTTDNLLKPLAGTLHVGKPIAKDKQPITGTGRASRKEGRSLPFTGVASQPF